MSHIFEILREAQRERALLDRAIASTATNSRNFEVLRLAQKDARLFEAAEPRAALPIEPAPPFLLSTRTRIVFAPDRPRWWGRC